MPKTTRRATPAHHLAGCDSRFGRRRAAAASVAALAVIASSVSLHAIAAPTVVQAQKPDWQPTWLGVELNGVVQPEAIFVRTADGRLWVDHSTASGWRVAIRPAATAREYLGRSYYALDEISSAALDWSIDPGRQMLALAAAPEAFLTTLVSGDSTAGTRPTHAAAGAFLNYDVTAAKSGGYENASGFFELGFFDGPVVATQTAVLLRDEEHVAGLRLDTSLTADFPERRMTLRGGDVLSAASQWGRSVRFAGLQWASNFATQPGLVTLPQPTLSGEAAAPSTIDILINGALRGTRSVPAGPFTITDVPVVAGDGLITARVRDAFGREQLISQSFYASPDLLRRGLDAYAFELGTLRSAYAHVSDAYGGAFAQGTWRRGMTDWTTVEVRFEALEDHATAGAGLVQVLGRKEVVQSAIVVSRAADTWGALALFGWEHAGRNFSCGGRIMLADDDFAQLGREHSSNDFGLEVALRAGWSSPRWGSAALAYARRDGAIDRAFFAATYARELGGLAHFSLTATREATGGSRLFASITQPIGRGRSLQYAYTRAGETAGQRAEVRQSRADSGLSYRAVAEAGSAERWQGDISWLGRAGQIGGEMLRRENSSGARVYASGSVGMIEARLYPMRRIDSNFAVVQVATLADVPIYLDDRPIARTRADGRAAIVGLRPYEPNLISIAPMSLPMDVHVAGDRVQATPFGRGGMVVTMPVEVEKSVLVRLIRADRTVVPAGARLLVGKRHYPVASDGLAFIAVPEGLAHFSASWRDGACSGVIQQDATANEGLLPAEATCGESSP